MSIRPARTRRPRLLPGAVLASALVVATAGSVLAATNRGHEPAVQACGPGQQWVTVHPVVVLSEWRPAATRSAGPSLAGCLDTSRLGPADRPQPTNPRG